MDLGRMLEETGRNFAGKTALIHNETRLSYSDLNNLVNSFANKLKYLGIGKGDKIAIILPNIPEFVISYFAAQKIGAVAVTLNIMSTAYELTYLLENSDSRIVVTTGLLAPRVEEACRAVSDTKEIIFTNGLDEPSPFRDALQGPFSFEIPEIGEDDPAVMIYTSGLTGKPLGAVLTHKNLFSQSDLLRNPLQGSENDRGLSVIPLFHSFGAVANMLALIRLGASMVMMDQFHIESIFRAIDNEKITFIGAVPRLFIGMLLQENPNKHKFDTLRLCITGGSAMPHKLIPDFEKKFNAPLLEGYGLTEASPVCAVNRIEKTQKFGSIGIPIPGVTAKIVNGNGLELPASDTGELIIRGVNVMRGYYKDDTATSDIIRDNWLHTGDLARIDEDGYIFLTGRKKRMIINSGFNVYPREIEIVLNMLPDVKDSLVIGVPDLMRGELVKALVIKKNGSLLDEKSVLKHCRTFLSSYKLPREVEFVESFK
ncbi:MAG: AMP-binding protein [Syntrophaceae bacterium]